MLTLPRSIRWRIQLGLLSVPPKQNWTIKDLEEVNTDEVQSQREKYEKLKREHQKELGVPRQVSRKRLDCFSSSCGSFSIEKKKIHPFPTFPEEVENELDTPCELQTEYLDSQDPLYQSVTSKIDATHDDIEDEFETPCERLNECLDVYNQYTTELQIEEHLISNIHLVNVYNCGSTIRSDLDEHFDVIVKDLKRLPSDHNAIYIKNVKSIHPLRSDDEATEDRCNQLMDILCIFTREHGEYLQGYHELASLFLLVLEMDVFESDQSPLLDRRYLSNDTYSTIEKLLPQLHAVYSGDNLDVESRLRFVSGDDKFRRHLMAVDATSGLYCARWTRLLFSREVDNWKTWLLLMDLLMDLTSQNPCTLSLGDISMYSRPGISPILAPGKMDWTTVLETTAASHIWMHRDELMAVDPSNALGVLLGFQPLVSVSGLTSILLSSVRRIQHEETPQCINASFETHVSNMRKSFTHPLKTLKRTLSRTSSSISVFSLN